MRCSVTVDPDLCMEISIDLLLTWQNERCSELQLIQKCEWKFPENFY